MTAEDYEAEADDYEAETHRLAAARAGAHQGPMPYFRAVIGPDGRYGWGRCPACRTTIAAKAGAYGRHWTEGVRSDAEATPEALAASIAYRRLL